jgi:2-polyprenyl-3-methyl-5-hydroxy-6-metoxy-1,4-benzoquinol methylase
LDPNYGKHYRELYKNHWWWRAREETVLEVLRRRIGSKANVHILDVGCGDGLFFDRLQEFGDVEGVEPAGELVDPKGPHRAKISVAPFDESFCPARRYSLILMLDVIEHVDQPESALRHAWTLLEPGGLLVITVPAFPMLWTNHDVLNQHRTRFTKARIRKLAKQARLRILDARYLFGWVFPAKLLLRAKEKITAAKPDIPRVPGPGWNHFLWRLSRAENRLALRVLFPVGSSLLVLATGENSNPD